MNASHLNGCKRLLFAGSLLLAAGYAAGRDGGVLPLGRLHLSGSRRARHAEGGRVLREPRRLR